MAWNKTAEFTCVVTNLLKVCVTISFTLLLAACGDSSTTMAPNEQESSSSWNIVFSSSSQNIESSSSLSSSEFVPLVAPCKTEMEDYCEYGELVDNRDGQTYKTVKIGSQTWMAENLNFKVDSSFCFNNEESYCSKYGRLYSWAAAVGKSEAECGFGYICSLPLGKIRGVCPEGWHLPDSTEWNVLFDVVGVKKIGTKVLKSMSGWDNNGSDAYGFSVLPAGWRKSTRGNFYGEYSFGDEGRGGYFWSASEIDGYEVDVRGSYRYPNPKGLDFSVRCVQDDASEQNSIISSSSVKSSSSEVQYGTLTDSRDGQTYRTVTIGKQIWMAENLNFKMDSSFCYDNKEINCAKGGRFYKWDYARHVCPAGWHLPEKNEWEVLITTVGGLSTAGKKLKFISGWPPSNSLSNGTSGSSDTDKYGFSAVPAGYWNSDNRNFYGGDAAFWSATTDTMIYYDGITTIDYVHYANSLMISSKEECTIGHTKTTSQFSGRIDRGSALSVRCLNDTGVVDTVKPCKNGTEDNCVYGELVDNRDGQTYKTVKIGDQVWMAENLNYEIDSSFCYKDSSEYCEKYGHLYTWDAAKAACPSGSHLPSLAEWKILIEAVGGGPIAVTALQSTSGWSNGDFGTDLFGFSVLPAGIRMGSKRDYSREGSEAFFWSSSENGNEAHYMTLYYYPDRDTYHGVYFYCETKKRAHSVRCLLDSVE